MTALSRTKECVQACRVLAAYVTENKSMPSRTEVLDAISVVSEALERDLAEQIAANDEKLEAIRQ